MPVPTIMPDLSATAGSNSPQGGEALGTLADDYIRALAAILRQTNARGTDIAAAATTNIGAATGEVVDVTTASATDVTITSLGTVAAGISRFVRFLSTGAGKIVLAHNTSTLVLPSGVAMTLDNGAVGIFRSYGGGAWVCFGISNRFTSLSYRFLGRTIYTASGTHTRVTGSIGYFVQTQAGGGGGAGSSASTTVAVCGGGGGGGYSELFGIYGAAPTVAVTVGAGGAGGAGGVAGAIGGTSAFSGVISVAGGNGGQVMTEGSTPEIANGGLGGAESTGLGYAQGSPGGYGLRLSGTIGRSGDGGASYMGSGGRGRNQSSGAGDVGNGFGGGGAGGASIIGGGARNGGQGANGVVIVWEYGAA